MSNTTSHDQFLISDYLLQRLSEIGVDHLFGVCGDFIMPFFERIGSSKVEHIGSCNELNAGYAADGYARVQGVGAAIVTGGVGPLSIINAVAGAYAEDVPIVVISGGPNAASFETQPKFHHTIPKNFKAPLKMMAEVTAKSVLLNNPETATADIDDAILTCLTTRKPVYIEIPVDVQHISCDRPQPMAMPSFVSTIIGDQVKSFVAKLAECINSTARTVICVGHEVERLGLQKELTALINKTGLPVASMMFGKAGYIESLDSCVGLYMGEISPEDIRHYVEEADNVLFIGVHETDMNMGLGTSKLQPHQSIFIRENESVFEDDVTADIPLGDFIVELTKQLDISEGLEYRKNKSPLSQHPHVS